MGQQHSYFRAVELIEREFERVQRDEIPTGDIDRNINLTQLQRFSLPEMFRLNTRHVAVLYVVDFNKDGLYSLDDFLNFARWVNDVLPSDREVLDFAETVQSRCVLKMWSDCEDLAGPAGPEAAFVDWCVRMLARSFPERSKQRASPAYAPAGAGSEPWQPISLPHLDGMKATAARLRGMSPPSDDLPPGNVIVDSDSESGTDLRAVQVADGAVDDNEEEEEEEFLRPIAPTVDAELVFGISAVNAMYVALNVREAYGLPFSVFCKILNPALGDRGVTMLSAAAHGTFFPASSMTGRFSLESSTNAEVTPPGSWAPHGSFLSAPSSCFASPAVLPPGVHNEFTVPEATMRKFLHSFIEAYWDILRRLGLHPLLTFAR
jgi:hypothetical protein